MKEFWETIREFKEFRNRKARKGRLCKHFIGLLEESSTEKEESAGNEEGSRGEERERKRREKTGAGNSLRMKLK